MICARRGGSVILVLAAAQNANLAVRFLLETGLLAVVAVAAWRSGRSPVARWARGVLLPAAVAVGWVLFVHGASVRSRCG